MSSMRWLWLGIACVLIACGARSSLDGPLEQQQQDAALDVTIAPDVSVPIFVDAGVDVVDAAVPFDASLPPFPLVRLGFDHGCAAMPSGSVRCWGRNKYGQLGDGTTTDHYAAADIAGLDGVTAVATGYRHTCIAQQDGSVKCWGDNDAHQVSTESALVITTPTKVMLDGPAVSLSAGSSFSCATLANGKTECWGTVLGGAYGSPHVASELGIAIETVTSADGNNLQILARDDAGSITCWDGVGTFAADCLSTKGTPVGLGSDIANMAFFSEYPDGAETCVVTSAHTLQCMTNMFSSWYPYNDHDGGSLMPTQPVQRIGMREQMACVLLTSGGVQCWQVDWQAPHEVLGPGVTNVPGITNAIDLTVGVGTACATLATYQVMCWDASLNSWQVSGF